MNIIFTVKQFCSNNMHVIAGLIFFCIQIFIFAINFQAEDKSFYYWFCNHIPILLSLAFFTKQYQIVKGLISVGLISQLLWIIDLSLGYFEIILFGFTSYVFELESLLSVVSILFIHVFSTLLALMFTIHIQPTRKSLYVSFIYLILLQIITLTLTPEFENINCVYEICGVESLTPPFFSLLWSILTFIVMIIPAFFIQIGIFKLYEKYMQNLK
ncbi:MAG: hypothetical protein ACLFPL_01940 [Candidatus Nanoarchaeia archaeon]